MSSKKRRKKNKDPFAEREASKYSNPIPSREFIMQYLGEKGKPVRRQEIIQDLGLSDDDQQEALRRRLRAMERDGQIVFNRRGGYGLVGEMGLIRGRVIGHRDGYGFVTPDEAGPDIFLDPIQMRSVFNGDRVLVRIIREDKRGRHEGQIVDVLERALEQIVGRLFHEGGIYFVASENPRITQNIVIPAEQIFGAIPGQYVVAQILVQPTSRTQAVGRIIEILGEHMAPGLEIDVAIRSFGLPHKWSEAVEKEMSHFPDKVTPEDLVGRVDLRKKLFITIDGEDAKDFDDAVYCEERKQGGWTLYVAIADVSHYVKTNTALDHEANQRGNSVYFPGRVIPMLPELLSNELCSLRPDRDRLAMVCEMTVTDAGNVSRFVFHEAVIHSHARMTYTNVAKILVDKNKALIRQYQLVLSNLEQLYRLYKVLNAKRVERGALDFDTTETKVIFGPQRKIKEIIPVVRNDAHRLIEECMLLANISSAKFLKKNQLISLYRVHQGPSEEKLVDLMRFLRDLGISTKGISAPKPKDYAKLLESVKGRPDAHLIQTVLLRSLSQAIYSPDNLGHFGLAYDCYTHFTSPIRRYPDLLVHRAIRAQLLKQDNWNQLMSHDVLVKAGEHCSMTERRADEATRDVLNWLKCEYMRERVGEEFSGIVTGVTAFGLFIELTDIFVEGLLHVTSLENDYYQFDPVKHRLTGRRTGMSYRIGDTLKVKVVNVNLDERKIDFIPAKMKTAKKTVSSKDSKSPKTSKRKKR